MSDPKIVFPKLKGGEIEEPAPDIAEPKISLPQMTPEQQFKAKLKSDNSANLARLRGLTFGLSDRAIAALKPGNYEDNLRELQVDRDVYRQENPVSAYGNELLMGVATGGAVSSGVRKLAGKVMPGLAQYSKQAGVLPTAVRATSPLAESALYGEVSHQAEQPYGKVGENLGLGAAYGAGAGTVLGIAGKGLGVAARKGAKIGQRAALAAGITSPDKFANKRFLRSLQEADMTPEEVLEAAKFLRGDDLQLHGPSLQGNELPDLRTPVRVADVLPRNSVNVVRKGAQSSERAQAELSDLISNRNAEQGMRLQGHVDSTLSDDVDSSAVLERLAQQRAQTAGPHYENAYKVGVVKDPIIDTWINDRKVNAKLFNELKKSLDDNASRGLGEGKPMQAVLEVDKKGNFVWKQRPTIEDLDTIKKHIDSKRNELWDPIQMKYRKPRQLGEPDAEQLKHQSDDLIAIIDKLTPDGKGSSHYANARKAFADDSELIDAQRAGMMIMRTRPEEVAKQFDKLSKRPELQQQFRAGVAASIKDLLDKADTSGGAAVVRKLWGSPGIQRKLEYVMADPSTAQLFRRNMAAEKAFTDTQKNLVPKSGSTDLLSDAEGFSLPLAAVNALSGRFGSAANHLGRFGMGAISGMTPEVGDDLTKIAMMTPEQFEKWVRGQRMAERTMGAKAKKVAGKAARYAGRGLKVSTAAQVGTIPTNEQNNSTDIDD